MNPTLVVGVGGTGCHVAKKLRKLIEDDVHPKDRDRIPMRFIGIDTHIADLKGLRNEEADLHFSMEISGRAVSLGDKCDRTEADESFKAWLPRGLDGKPLADPEHLASGNGAGGNRLTGRYAFKFFAPKKFKEAQFLVEQLRDICSNPVLPWNGIQYRASQRIEVFVVCSLAGGTGSGAFLDTVAMCHKLLAEVAPNLSHGIHLVLVMPSAFEYETHDSLHRTEKATAYACLKDLDHLMDAGPKTFEFLGGKDVTVHGRIADDVFLLGRHGSKGTITNIDDLYRTLAIQLYGLIGTPMGTSYKLVSDNNAAFDSLDTHGGRKRYGSFGIIGLDYDLPSRNYRIASAIAKSAAQAIRKGAKGVELNSSEIEEQGINLVSEFLNGLAAPSLQKMVEIPSSSLKLPDGADGESPKEILARINTLCQGRSEATVSKEIRESIRKQWEGNKRDLIVGWSNLLTDNCYSLVEEYGTQGAQSIIECAIEQMTRSRQDLANRARSSSISALQANAVSRLNSIGLFKRLLQQEESRTEILAVINDFNNGVRALCCEFGAQAFEETVHGSKGITWLLLHILEQVKSADDTARRTYERLDIECKSGLTPSSNALDRSSVIYDVVTLDYGSDPKIDASLGRNCFKAWIETQAGEQKGQALIARLNTMVEQTKKLNSPACVALAKELMTIAPLMLEGDLHEHILDVLMPEDDDTYLQRCIDEAVQMLTPLAIVNTHDPSVSVYDTTMALLPTARNGSHPKAQVFEKAFKQSCKNSGFQQVRVDEFGGAIHRIVVSTWILGFALNPETYPPLSDLLSDYQRIRRLNPTIEVDRRWMQESGPGQQETGGRSLLWTLGLAFGLIVQGSGSYYFNNLKTSQNRVPGTKGTLEEYEVDAEAIINAIRSGKPASEWIKSVIQGVPGQKLGRKQVGLAISLGQPATVNRKVRDRFGNGRAESMHRFIADMGEDYSDVETGLILVLNALVESIGKGQMLTSLEAYRDKLEDIDFSDDTMKDQLSEEISMLNLAIESLKDRGNLGLPNLNLVI